MNERQKKWDRLSYRAPFRADVPAGVVPPISRAIFPCLVLPPRKDGGLERWGFTRRSHRDQFVSAWRGHGARNA